MSIGEQIRKYREQQKMDKHILAEALDVSPELVSMWENDLAIPETPVLVRLAKSLNTTVGRILEEDSLPSWHHRYRLFNEEHLCELIIQAAEAHGMSQTMAALNFAIEKHSHKNRKCKFEKIPYVIHPLTMACQALSYGLYDDVLISALLLHDVIEDSDAELSDLPVGHEVREIVDLVTKRKPFNKAIDNPKYFERIQANPYACIVKVMDRISNLSEMYCGFTHEKMAGYVSETEQFIVPLLGIIQEHSGNFQNAVWSLSYQMFSLLETYKILL